MEIRTYHSLRGECWSTAGCAKAYVPQITIDNLVYKAFNKYVEGKSCQRLVWSKELDGFLTYLPKCKGKINA